VSEEREKTVGIGVNENMDISGTYFSVSLGW
jgi:hypothetical protein